MTTARMLYALPITGLLVASGGGCASTQRAQSPAEQTAAARERSQRAFSQAQEEQKRAAEQQQRVESAHQEVLKAQQQLTQAQDKEAQERSKAEQLQQQANQHLREASEQAHRASEQALQESAAATEGQPRGMQVVTGQVRHATPDQVVLQTEGGQTMTFNVDERTRVFVGGEQRSAADIQQGADAQVAYDTSGGRPTALTIQVRRAAIPGTEGH